jgi:putative heme-binding domain-containing protein
LRESDDLLAAARLLVEAHGLEAEGARLAGAGGLRALRPELEAIAAGSRVTGKEARAAAVNALAALDDRASVPVLARLAADRASGVSEEAAAALGQMGGSEPQQALRSLVVDAGAPEVRSAAVKALGGSKSGAVLLLHMAKEGDLPDAARALATTVVHSSAYEDVRLLADKILPRPTTGGGKALPPLAELAARKGDASRGRAVFQDEGRGNCARCHRIRGKGSDVGPDLSAIGTKLGRQGLFEAILSPSAAIAHEYRPWILETRSAGFVTGYVVDDTPEKVSIRDANGKSFSFARDDVVGRTGSDVSLMPEGLTGAMTTDDLVDLVEYLSRQAAPAGAGARPVPVRDWMLAGPFPNAEEKGFDAVYPPEEGVDLSREYRGRDGAVKWRRVRASREGVLDLARELDNANASVTYLFAVIQAPREVDAEILLGSDDGVKVWVNGKLVLSNHVHRPLEPEADQAHARLREGRNEVLVKVENGDGAAGLHFAVGAAERVSVEAPPGDG